MFLLKSVSRWALTGQLAGGVLTCWFLDILTSFLAYHSSLTAKMGLNAKTDSHTGTCGHLFLLFI